MKKGLIITLFLTMSLVGFAQQEVVVGNDTELIETKKLVKPVAKQSDVSSKYKAKVLKMNHKKSNEIISIKAYRKSLQIRVKTVKYC